MSTQTTNIYLYTRYERFWHWLQMALIVTLLITGFEVHDVFDFLGFGDAVGVHNFVGISWLIAFAFFVFWVFTTGEWRQYVPTTKRMLSVIRYYGYGIFKGENHPFPKRKEAKHNPLQRLAYLSLATILLPVQMASGFLYWGYNSWPAWGIDFLNLQLVAIVHTAGAFAILSFLVGHVYMTTTGHSLFDHIRSMITGWERIEAGVDLESWERAGRSEADQENGGKKHRNPSHYP